MIANARGSVVTGNNRSDESLLTATELADYLAVPVKTLYAWRYQRKGPPGFRVGRHLRYRRTDVQQWIDGQIDA